MSDLPDVSYHIRFVNEGKVSWFEITALSRERSENVASNEQDTEGGVPDSSDSGVNGSNSNVHLASIGIGGDKADLTTCNDTRHLDLLTQPRPLMHVMTVYTQMIPILTVLLPKRRKISKSIP